MFSLTFTFTTRRAFRFPCKDDAGQKEHFWCRYCYLIYLTASFSRMKELVSILRSGRLLFSDQVLDLFSNKGQISIFKPRFIFQEVADTYFPTNVYVLRSGRLLFSDQVLGCS